MSTDLLRSTEGGEMKSSREEVVIMTPPIGDRGDGLEW